MTPYPDNVRQFTTQESVQLGDSGFDVEVEIVRRTDVEILRRGGKEVVSIGLKEHVALPPMAADGLFVVFDLGTVLDIVDVQFKDPESGHRLTVEGNGANGNGGPVRVPVVLNQSASVTLVLSADQQPFGALIVDIARDGKLTGGSFSPHREPV